MRRSYIGYMRKIMSAGQDIKTLREDDHDCNRMIEGQSRLIDQQNQKIEELSQRLEKQMRLLVDQGRKINKQRQRFGTSFFDLTTMQRWTEGSIVSAEYIRNNMPNAKCFRTTIGDLKTVRGPIHYYVLDGCSDDGLILEFGVYGGESINYFAKAKPQKTIYGFDSFEGLPEAWPGMCEAGRFSTEGDQGLVRKNAARIHRPTSGAALLSNSY